jgi:hypothetical protein
MSDVASYPLINQAIDFKTISIQKMTWMDAKMLQTQERTDVLFYHFCLY